MADGWFNLLSGFAGVVVGSATTIVRDWCSDRRRDKREVAYLAVTVAGRLEQFARSCLDVALDNGLCEGRPNDRGFHEAQVPTPELELEALPVEWKSLPGPLLYDILNLPYRLQTTLNVLEGIYRHDELPDYPEFFDTRRALFAALGSRAIDLALQLRMQAGFRQQSDLENQYVQLLQTQLHDQGERIEAQRDARHKRRVAVNPFPDAPSPDSDQMTATPTGELQ